MRFPPLVCGRLVRRYKRFLVDVELEGVEVTAHCANSGSMRNCIEPGGRVWLSESDNPARKLRYTLELHEVGGCLHLLNTQRPNAIIAEGLKAGRWPDLAVYPNLRREVVYGDHSRVDLLLSGGGLPDCYVEVKSASMGVGNGITRFPDAVTSRGTKHLLELAKRVELGERAILLFAASRADTRAVGIANDIDPLYAKTLNEVRQKGVEIRAARIVMSPEEAYMDEEIEVILDA